MRPSLPGSFCPRAAVPLRDAAAWRAAGGGAILLLALAACPLRAQQAPIPFRNASVSVERLVAAVADRVILSSDVMNLVAGNEQALREQLKGAEAERKVQELYEKGLNLAIERALILEEFKASKGQVPELLVQDRLDEIVARRFDGDRTRFQAALAEERKTLESLREEIREEITVSLLRRQEVSDRIAVTPAQVREAYEERRASYFTPERVRLRLISLNREGLPEDLLEKKVASVSAALAAKRDFAEVAKDYSDFLPEKAGELGVMVKSDMRSDFRKAILGLSAGQTAGPIPGDKEIAFLQVVEILPEVTKSLESVQADLERELRRKAEEEIYKGWISRLRLKYPVVIYPGRS